MSQRAPSWRRRLHLDTVLATLLGLAAVLTVWRPDWIEAVHIGDPDRGSGTLERLIVLLLAVSATLAAGSARRSRAVTASAVERM